MTEDELRMIKEHIEIHARREPRAIKITQILWKAVEELEATKELQEELDYAKSNCLFSDCDRVARLKSQNVDLEKENARLKIKAKEIIREFMRFESMIGTCSFYSEEYEKTKKKAEAFLKE